MTVDMEVGCKKNKHLHDHFISTKVHILAYKTSLTPPHFIEKPVPNQDEFSSRVYMWFICIFLLSFDEIVLTVWCFFHVILYKQKTEIPRCVFVSQGDQFLNAKAAQTGLRFH